MKMPLKEYSNLLIEQYYLVKFPIENRKRIIHNDRFIFKLSQKTDVRYNKRLIYWLLIYSYLEKILLSIIFGLWAISFCVLLFYYRILDNDNISDRIYHTIDCAIFGIIISAVLRLMLYFEIIPFLSPKYYWQNYSIKLLKIQRQLNKKKQSIKC